MPHSILLSSLVHVLLFGLVSLPATVRADTPAERRIAAANASIDAALDPATRAGALVALAEARTARARETGDGAHYAAALQDLERARAIGPDHRDLAKIEAFVRLGRHEFAAAESLAGAFVALHPEDHEAWGLLGDARMELGRSEEAADAWQRMMDLRPGPGAFLRAAYYRERVEDDEGALEFLARAQRATGPAETEQRAWTLVHMAALDERLGRPAIAEARLEAALATFPDYHYALAALAELHLEQGRPERALAFARRVVEIAPHAERWLTLADALRAVGREAEAREAEDTFLRGALENVDQPDNENLFLVDFYLDRRPDPVRALALARREAERRRDPGTLARLARASDRVAGRGADAGEPE